MALKLTQQLLNGGNMKNNAVKFLGLLLITALSFSSPSFADENETQALKSEVNDLNSKVDALTRQVQVLTSTPRDTGTAYVASPTEGGALQGVTVSGYVDTQYNNNFSNHNTNPNTANAGAGNTGLRIFDNNQNTFTVNSVEVDVEKLANPEGGAGFRFDMQSGEDVRIIKAGNTSAAANSDFYLQQAYVQFVAPLSVFSGSEVFADTIDIKAGRFVTLAGLEVIEGKDNWNISRSYMFGLGIPFTHTGVRGTYGLFNDKVTTYFGLNNGWDANIDTNTFKTWELGWTTAPTDALAFTQALYWGPENANAQNGHRRFLLTNVVSYQATEKLALKAEMNVGTQRRVVTAGPVTDNAQWWGLALYGRYALTEKFGMATRFELFRDKDKTRTAVAGATPTSTLWAWTVTADRQIYENLIGRLEYRFDKSNETTAFAGESSQSTLGAQLIYSFA
jgi:hypothetical protein